MPLSPQEQAELDQLNSEAGGGGAGLSPQEQAELQQLNAESGGASPVMGMDKSSAPEPGRGNTGQAALEGFGETATMGYLPQLQAVAEKPMTALLNKLTGQNVEAPDYLQARDENLRRQASLSAENPEASMGGKALGIAAGMLGPGLAGKGIVKAALSGAAQGAAYNPGDTEGKIDPLQLEQRGENALMGGAVGGATAGISKLIENLANKSRMVGAVKDSAKLGDTTKETVDSALQALTENEVTPRAQQLNDLLKGKSVKVRASQLRGTENEQLSGIADLLQQRALRRGNTDLPAQRANVIKRALDAESKYTGSAPFAPEGKTSARGIKSAADAIRKQLEGISPEVGQLNEGMANALAKRNALAKASRRSPIASITAEPGTDKASLIDAIDKMSGSKLEALGQDIKSASKLMLKPERLIKPLEAPDEIRKMAVRAAAGTARAVEPGVKAVDALSLKAILEGKRESNPNDRF